LLAYVELCCGLLEYLDSELELAGLEAYNIVVFVAALAAVLLAVVAMVELDLEPLAMGELVFPYQILNMLLSLLIN
jgi:hypothetical protein